MNWIEAQREELVRIYKKCRNEKEQVLEAFSLYLLRILNGLAQMEGNDSYGYESQILGQAMRLFCIYYVEQVDEALRQGTDFEKKDGIIEDLEDAISKISNVYKNVIDSTSNSDRQLFTSHAVETSIYDISPKLFATYSMVLETLVTLFGQQDLYAFLLHPSLKSSVETVNLFDIRQQTGKVVLIYIPENKIERVRQIPFFLLHEAFHVLTKEERCREDRACMMESHMYNGILQRLFRNISFDFIGEEDEILEIKNQLMQRWFKKVEWAKELRSRGGGNDREFYSRNVIAKICANWRDALRNVFGNLGDDLCEVLAKRSRHGLEGCFYKELLQVDWGIRKNLVEILAGNKVELYAEAYMQMYREAYADIASILATGISPDIYVKAFLESQTELQDKAFGKDALREIRIYIVAQAVAGCAKVQYAEEWKAYRDEHDPRKTEEKEDGERLRGEGEPSRAQKQADQIWIEETDLDALERILKECGEKLWEKLRTPQFEKFRKVLEEMDMVAILRGKANKELMKLRG